MDVNPSICAYEGRLTDLTDALGPLKDLFDGDLLRRNADPGVAHGHAGIRLPGGAQTRSDGSRSG